MSDHDIDVLYVPICEVCQKDVHLDDQDKFVHTVIRSASVKREPDVGSYQFSVGRTGETVMFRIDGSLTEGNFWMLKMTPEKAQRLARMLSEAAGVDGVLQFAEQLNAWARANDKQAASGTNRDLCQALAVEQRHYASRLRRIVKGEEQ